MDGDQQQFLIEDVHLKRECWRSETTENPAEGQEVSKEKICKRQRSHKIQILDCEGRLHFNVNTYERFGGDRNTGAVLGIQLMICCMLNKPFTTELHPYTVV